MARRPQGDRNARAQRRLAELGQAPGPLRGAEYRLRRYEGQRRGLSGGQAVGKPRRGERLVSELRARGALPAPQRRVAPRAPRDAVFPAAGARTVNTADMRYLAQQIRAAAAAGERVAFRVTADKGQGPRTRAIDGRNPAQQQLILGRAGTADTAGNHRGGRRSGPRNPMPSESGGAVAVVGRVQMTAGPPSAMGDAGGFDPDEVLDWLDTYDDPWEAWADAWDAEYEAAST